MRIDQYQVSEFILLDSDFWILIIRDDIEQILVIKIVYLSMAKNSE